MKAAPFQYQRATSVDHAAKVIQSLGGMGKIMAGGQTLMPMMNLRLTMLETVLDISHIDDWRTAEDLGDKIRIGAMTTHAMIEDGFLPERFAGYLRHVAGGIAYRSIRTRGTIGGSLCHADPAADWPTALLAVNAQAEVLRAAGGREIIPLSEFQVGLMETALGPEDLLLALHVPTLSNTARWSYQKFCRKVGEFAHSIVAIVHDPAHNYGNCVLGAAADKPVRLPALSDWLTENSNTSSGSMADVSDRIEADLASVEDLEAKTYAFQLHRTMLTRAFRELLDSK